MRTDLKTVAFRVQTSVHICALRQGTQQGHQDGVLGGTKAETADWFPASSRCTHWGRTSLSRTQREQDVPVQKNEGGPLSHATPENWLQMDHRPKCKT